MVIGTIAERMQRGVEGMNAAVSETLFEPVIRLGVTGLSRAGKTVFITSLVANLLERGRMPGLAAVADGRMQSAFLQPQPDDTLPRFEYETHLSALTGPEPHWPSSTRAISELRLSMRLRPAGLLGGLSGRRILHLDIVDYPGEWLLDLALLERDYPTWSKLTLERIEARRQAAGFRERMAQVDGDAPLSEPVAQDLARSFTAYLNAAREAGYSDCTPGRFLLPGDLEGSPVLTFAPLPPSPEAPRGSLWREMARRYDAYRREVVRPFFRDHFARIDRQVVLVDALGAIHAGPPAVADLRRTLTEVLEAFRPGQNGLLASLLGSRRVEKILFAATKADHLHHRQHARLTAIMAALMRDAKRRADFAGAETAAMSLAALRATVEETRAHRGEELDLVRGRLLDTGRQAAFYPGELPDEPSRLLQAAQSGDPAWLDADYKIMRFAPAPISLAAGDGPPHIRLDRAAQFLFGDRL